MKAPSTCYPSLPPSHAVLQPALRGIAASLEDGRIDKAVAIARTAANCIAELCERAAAGDSYAARVMTSQGWNAMDATDWIAWLVGRANELEASQGLQR